MMEKRKILKSGDYVLGTNWVDGDPCDPFYVGFITEVLPQGYIIENQRTIFHRAELITKKEGEELIKIFPLISDIPGQSLWQRLAIIREKIK